MRYLVFILLIGLLGGCYKESDFITDNPNQKELMKFHVITDSTTIPIEPKREQWQPAL